MTEAEVREQIARAIEEKRFRDLAPDATHGRTWNEALKYAARIARTYDGEDASGQGLRWANGGDDD